MPSSRADKINEIVQMIMLTNPHSLLDVGVGFGKYGVLAREYLELWDGREKYSVWKRRIDGIEAYEPYVTALHKYVYDDIYVGDVSQIVSSLPRRYNLVLMIDVLEHFERQQGIKVVRELQSIGENVLIAVPIKMHEQGASFGNVYETHRGEWKKRHLERLYNFDLGFVTQVGRSWICYLGRKAKRVKEGMSEKK